MSVWKCTIPTKRRNSFKDYCWTSMRLIATALGLLNSQIYGMSKKLPETSRIHRSVLRSQEYRRDVSEVFEQFLHRSRQKISPSPLWKEGLKSAPEKIPPLKKGDQGGFRCGLYSLPELHSNSFHLPAPL